MHAFKENKEKGKNYGDIEKTLFLQKELFISFVPKTTKRLTDIAAVKNQTFCRPKKKELKWILKQKQLR